MKSENYQSLETKQHAANEKFEIDSAILEKKRIVSRELEKRLTASDRSDYEQLLEKARQLAGGDPLHHEGISWIELYTLLGCHPSYVLQVWCWFKCRSNPAAPNFEP